MRRFNKLTLLISIFALNHVTCDINWMTQLGAEWTFECPTGTSLKILLSAPAFQHHDRLWNFTCSGSDAKIANATCEWSDYANDFNKLFNFQCPDDGIIKGIASTYNGYDRRYKFLCCSPTGYIAHACQFTPNVNALGGFMNYRRADNWYIRGFTSEWGTSSVGYYDRVFSLNMCKLDKSIPCYCTL